MYHAKHHRSNRVRLFSTIESILVLLDAPSSLRCFAPLKSIGIQCEKNYHKISNRTLGRWITTKPLAISLNISQTFYSIAQESTCFCDHSSMQTNARCRRDGNGGIGDPLFVFIVWARAKTNTVKAEVDGKPLNHK